MTNLNNLMVQAGINFSGSTVIFVLAFLLTAGCASFGPENMPGDAKSNYSPGTILSGKTGKPVSFDDMICDLLSVDIVYVGETHTSKKDHEIQLEILKTLNGHLPDLAVGMEMFARPYQKILNDWSGQRLSEIEFIRKTHWYANWKYDFDLYAALLSYIRENSLDLYALNISFHIPSKIAVGGIDSLLPDDMQHLPENINFENPEHRKYLESVFEKHKTVKEHFIFQHFYQAQCVWEDTMAETISRHAIGRPIIVFAGNGHIVNKFGIPMRAYFRTKLPYRTVMPVSKFDDSNPGKADYLWITGEKPKSPHQF